MQKQTITTKILSIGLTLALVTGLMIFGIWSYLGSRRPEPPRSVNQEAALQVRTISFEKIELAGDNSSRQMGLMNRQELCETCAMLFVFEEEDELSFWMQNTFISLDMIFMDENGLIVTVHSNTKPQTTTSYASSKPAKYVLEVNAGFAKEYQLEEGVGLSIPALIEQSVEYGS